MWLALETSSDLASVAVERSGGGVAERETAGARRHAGALLPMIASALRDAHATLDDVTGVAVSDGPGSFTGLRVGASVAKALVRSRGLPLWTAPSLLVRALGVARSGAVVLAVSDALRGELYAAAYRFDEHAIERLLVPTVLRADVLVAGELRPDVLVGEAPAPAAALLERWSGVSLVAPPIGAPHARALLDLVKRAGGAHPVTAVQQWEPEYGRPAEAQARWEAAHGRALSDSFGRAG